MKQQIIPDGYKQTEVGIIPDDWKVAQINEIAGIKVGGDVDEVNISSESDKKYCYPVYSNTVENPGIYGFYNYSEHKEDAVTVVGRGVGLGTAICRRGGFGAIGRLIVLTPKFNGIFLSNYINARVDVFSESSGVPQLTGVAIGNYTIALPSEKEQTAIANALSDVDALITSIEKLISKKQAIKTATMQQLLTGKKRLPPFDKHPDGTLKATQQTELGEIPENWKVQDLKSLLKENPKYGINAAAVPLTGSFPIYIRITDIGEDGCFRSFKKVGVDSPFSYDYKLVKGDLVLARTGASVGKSYIYRESDGELIYAGFLIKVSPNEKKLNSEFLFQVFKTQAYWSWVTVMSMRSGQPGINGNEYSQFQFLVPSIEEQLLIAIVFSDMDKDIKSLQKRLTKTQKIKQGMMQELLTGKTRLPFDKTKMQSKDG